MMFERNYKWFIAAALCVVGTSACSEPLADESVADARNACFTCTSGPADNLSIPEPSYLADAVLEVANTQSLDVLDDDAALDARAARAIVEIRSEGRFTTLQELDDVPWVGPKALRALVDFAYAHGFVGTCGDHAIQPSLETCDDGNSIDGDGCSSRCETEASTVTVHGIAEGSASARAILDVVNHASFDVLDDDIELDRRAARSIVEERPFDSLTALDAAPWVGASAFEALSAYATDADGCTQGEFEGLVSAINATRFNGNFARHIRTDVALVDILDQRMWPGEATRVACFGIDEHLTPSWIPTHAPEDGERIYALTEAFAYSANRAGADINPEPGLEELMCRTQEMTFSGCRFDFEPNPFTGISWTYLESSDGTMRYFYESAWTE